MKSCWGTDTNLFNYFTHLNTYYYDIYMYRIQLEFTHNPFFLV